ncbi:MAG: hypothetical protein GY757_31310 [bacterium]|nr:hypothetical protein [bacterium]
MKGTLYLETNTPYLARAYPKRKDEHEVHPYTHRDILSRGESCIRPNYIFSHF